jgi:hypothetical protein
MTSKGTFAAQNKKAKEEIQDDLEEMIVDAMRKAALPNALAFIGVVGGSFVIVLLVLIMITGG